MSLINDALKRARNTPIRGMPHSQPPLQPVVTPPSVTSHLLPAIVVFLSIAAFLTIGWAVARHSMHNAVNPANPVAAAQPGKPAAEPAAAPPPSPQTPPVSAEPFSKPADINPPTLPRLQGIFYSPTTPAAIVDGQTVRPGDHFLQYQVKGITRDTVILIDSNGQKIQLGMGK